MNGINTTTRQEEKNYVAPRWENQTTLHSNDEITTTTTIKNLHE